MEGSIKLETNITNNMLTQSTLLEKGWTLGLIKKSIPNTKKECDLQIKSIWNSYYGKISA